MWNFNWCQILVVRMKLVGSLAHTMIRKQFAWIVLSLERQAIAKTGLTKISVTHPGITLIELLPREWVLHHLLSKQVTFSKNKLIVFVSCVLNSAGRTVLLCRQFCLSNMGLTESVGTKRCARFFQSSLWLFYVPVVSKLVRISSRLWN